MSRPIQPRYGGGGGNCGGANSDEQPAPALHRPPLQQRFDRGGGGGGGGGGHHRRSHYPLPPWPTREPQNDVEVRALVVLFLCNPRHYKLPVDTTLLTRDVRKRTGLLPYRLTWIREIVVNDALNWICDTFPESIVMLRADQVGVSRYILTDACILKAVRTDALMNNVLTRIEPVITQMSAEPPGFSQRPVADSMDHAMPHRHQNAERPIGGPGNEMPRSVHHHAGSLGPPPVNRRSMDLDELLNVPTSKEKQTTSGGQNREIAGLLAEPTARQALTTGKFQNRQGSSSMREICKHGTRAQCMKAHGHHACGKVHFRKVILPHTETMLGDCSYLDSCRNMDRCKFVHYEVDLVAPARERMDGSNQSAFVAKGTKLGPASFTHDLGVIREGQVNDIAAQWVKCDIRTFPFHVLKQLDLISVIMADPPWDIHMDLPYGTMRDQEMLQLRVQDVQNEGVLFLWVTGRAMELARDCMTVWGYRRVDELIWVKTNQLQRIIRTGRTGHWINHSKEHCLIGVKGNPKINRNIDCDVLVSEVRETSRKPDEVYRLIERMSPGTVKLELFGRPHNTRNNWLTLGNQLNGTRMHIPELVDLYNQQPGVEKYNPHPQSQQPLPLVDRSVIMSRTNEKNQEQMASLSNELQNSLLELCKAVTSAKNPDDSLNATTNLREFALDRLGSEPLADITFCIQRVSANAGSLDPVLSDLDQMVNRIKRDIHTTFFDDELQ
eukprot:GHVL01018983.1.p1 GENE.GHVL01018983.1~~GHVL01018983.1.p1  ORF type:complete len:724 (+),score=86.08 GHVL01018983.1:51-2222(+)